jgi:hypothetical protein
MRIAGRLPQSANLRSESLGYRHTGCVIRRAVHAGRAGHPLHAFVEAMLSLGLTPLGTQSTDVGMDTDGHRKRKLMVK